jgi:hypothetical protein
MRDLPNTLEQRKAVHVELLAFATSALHTGGVKGLSKYLMSFQDRAFAGRLIFWLEKYTPIRRDTRCKDRTVFIVPTALRESYDLGGARLNPFYTLDAPPTPPTVDAKVKQLSERAFFRKSIHLALDKLLAEPTVEARQELLKLIAHIETPSSTKGRPMLQGGAPGLGKRA